MSWPCIGTAKGGQTKRVRSVLEKTRERPLKQVRGEKSRRLKGIKKVNKWLKRNSIQEAGLQMLIGHQHRPGLSQHGIFSADTNVGFKGTTMTELRKLQ